MQKINKKILIIEDDQSFFSILQKRFTMEGFSVVSAQDGQEGLSMLEKEKPDLIVSDVLLPKMDGIDMAKKIKEKNINVPILFLTNVKDPSYLERAKDIEFDYLVKSDVHVDEIVAKIKNKLGI